MWLPALSRRFLLAADATPLRIASELVRAANEAGGPDNISVVVALATGLSLVVAVPAHFA